MAQQELIQNRNAELSGMASLFVILFLFSQTTSTVTHTNHDPAFHQQVVIEQIATSGNSDSDFRFYDIIPSFSDTYNVPVDLFSRECQHSWLQLRHSHLSHLYLSILEPIQSFRDHRQSSLHSQPVQLYSSESPSDLLFT